MTDSLSFFNVMHDRFLNVDGLQHNVVFSRVPEGVDPSELSQPDLFDSGSVDITFPEVGTYMYFSAPHLYQGMVGKIIVT